MHLTPVYTTSCAATGMLFRTTLFTAETRSPRRKPARGINRANMSNIDLDYGAAVAAIAIESVARAVSEAV